MLAEYVRRAWLNKDVVCIYDDNKRIGRICFVKQGPAIIRGDKFFYMNEINGDVYVDWVYTSGKMRCFKWDRIKNLMLLSDAKNEEAKPFRNTLSVKRAIPITITEG